MLANGYPEYPSHKAEHDSLTRKVVDFTRTWKPAVQPSAFSCSSF